MDDETVDELGPDIIPPPPDAPVVDERSLTRLEAAARASSATSRADSFQVDSKAVLARALVENAEQLTDEAAAVETYMLWAWGEDLAAPFIQRNRENRLRMNGGVGKYFVDALNALAKIDVTEAKLFGAFGKAKD